MGRNPLRLSLVAALLLVLSTYFAPSAVADETRLDVSVASSPTLVSISGTLLADGKPLKRRDVTALIDGTEVGSAQTRGNGTFTIAAEFSKALKPGSHSVTVRFGGGKGADPASTMVNFQIGAAAGNEPDAVEPVKPPVAAELKLSVRGPADAINSEVVELSGTLADASGRGVRGAGISLHDAAGEVADAYAVTDAKGSFSTWYTVPDDQPEGDLKLSLLATGAGTARASITIPITRTELEKSPSPTPTPTASPTPTVTPTPTPTAMPTPTPTPTGEASTGVSIEVDTRSGPISALFGATLGVAVLATISLGALAARLRRRRAVHDAAGSLEFFADEDEAPTLPTAGTPRRGLPAD